jgi:hypothetical protein
LPVESRISRPAAGGREYLVKLATSAVTITNAQEYARITAAHDRKLPFRGILWTCEAAMDFGHL